MKRSIYYLQFFFLFLSIAFNSVAEKSFTTQSEINIQQVNSKLNIFPNPVTGNKFQIIASIEIKSVSLTNIVGQNVDVEILKKNPKQLDIITQNMNQGIYLVTILFTDKSKEVKKIIVR